MTNNYCVPHCENNFGNAVPRRSRWKRYLNWNKGTTGSGKKLYIWHKTGHVTDRWQADRWTNTYIKYHAIMSFSVRPHCKNARRDRCQEYHNCFPFGELEETTRTSSYYMDEDYPARPEIKQSLPGWGDTCGSESSTLETDICVWRYAPLVVHATQEEEEEEEEEGWLVQSLSASYCCSSSVSDTAIMTDINPATWYMCN